MSYFKEMKENHKEFISNMQSQILTWFNTFLGK